MSLTPMRVYWLNVAGFVVGSVLCYQGALRGVPWLGLAAIPIQWAILLPLTRGRRQRLALAVGVGVGGFVLDTALVAGGVYAAAPTTRWVLPPPLCPEWILALWLNFGFMLFLSWQNLRGKAWLGAVSGLLYAFMIYGGARGQGLVFVGDPGWVRILAIGVVWAVVVPLLCQAAARLSAWNTSGGAR